MLLWAAKPNELLEELVHLGRRQLICPLTQTSIIHWTGVLTHLTRVYI